MAARTVTIRASGLEMKAEEAALSGSAGVVSAGLVGVEVSVTRRVLDRVGSLEVLLRGGVMVLKVLMLGAEVVAAVVVSASVVVVASSVVEAVGAGTELRVRVTPSDSVGAPVVSEPEGESEPEPPSMENWPV